MLVVCDPGPAGRSMPPGAIYAFAHANLSWSDLAPPSAWAVITMLRVVVLIALASLVWTPVGIYVGLRPRLTRIVQPVAQFLAAFPANILFPLVVSMIVHLVAQSRHLAVAADGAGHPMVHPVQRHRGRQHHAARIAATPATISGCKGWLWWKQGRAARGVSLLRDRRHHRLGRLLERRDRGGSGELGQPHRCMPMAWAPISPTPPRPAISARSCWASR